MIKPFVSVASGLILLVLTSVSHANSQRFLDAYQALAQQREGLNFLLNDLQ